MKVVFTEDGWNDYLHRARHDTDLLQRVNDLIQDVRRSPHRGLGKPEPLKAKLAGFWSRRITVEHRLVYAVDGKGDAQQVVIIQCRFHY